MTERDIQTEPGRRMLAALVKPNDGTVLDYMRDSVREWVTAAVVEIERAASLAPDDLRDVLDEHTPWARAEFAAARLWMACSCGWNAMGHARDEVDGTWNEHFFDACGVPPRLVEDPDQLDAEELHPNAEWNIAGMD